ncbi:YraN family protein [uncultured Roseobacter sp.]|uniref:YraN family protein n=1 Tax=uncultured Roseobacter sp. TaxID=114847 RepID=UPI00262A4EDE|nr:YraN family protein [uncultured Roseobacter sp.]
MTARGQQSQRGAVSYHAGRAAENAVARHYGELGYEVAAERWRGVGGEIDLIVQDAERVIFVEVKKSRSLEAAALRLSRGQMDRICVSASEYLGQLPNGALTEARFDVALMDATGAVKIIENAFGEG